MISFNLDLDSEFKEKNKIYSSYEFGFNINLTSEILLAGKPLNSACSCIFLIDFDIID